MQKPKPTEKQIADAKVFFKTDEVLTKYGYLKAFNVLEAQLSRNGLRTVQHEFQMREKLTKQQWSFFADRMRRHIDRKTDIIQLLKYNNAGIQQIYENLVANPETELRELLDIVKFNNDLEEFQKHSDTIHTKITSHFTEFQNILRDLERETPPTIRDVETPRSFIRWLKRAVYDQYTK